MQGLLPTPYSCPGSVEAPVKTTVPMGPSVPVLVGLLGLELSGLADWLQVSRSSCLELKEALE